MINAKSILAISGAIACLAVAYSLLFVSPQQQQQQTTLLEQQTQLQYEKYYTEMQIRCRQNRANWELAVKQAYKACMDNMNYGNSLGARLGKPPIVLTEQQRDNCIANNLVEMGVQPGEPAPCD